MFNNSSPNKGVGVNITLPFRNRAAQADQARSQMEYRQSQMRLQQLYTQIRIQVINAQYALTNDRAQVAAAQAARDYAAAESGRGAEEVQAGRFDHGECAAAGKAVGDLGEYADLGYGSVCAGSRGAAATALEYAGPVRHQH